MLEEDLKMYGRLEDPGQTWIETDGEIYGARPDERGPIGGGEGYADLFTAGDHRVSTLEELLEALNTARPGQTVFVGGGAKIDCTTLVHIDTLVLEVPAGVTLASDRGQRGSRGALIFSDVFETRPLIRAAGPHVRISGLRIRGPDPDRRMDHHRRSFAEGRGQEYYYRFPISSGISTEHPGLRADNCELAGWSLAAVDLRGGADHRIQHNYIHHNQYQGLGYGICLDMAESLIEHNLFNFNRHSIAGTGAPGTSYEAAHNVELGESLSHCFDMHGGRDRKDGTEIAGAWIWIHHNTFRAPQTPIVIRGIPERECRIGNNWFPNHSPPGGGEGKAAVRCGEKTQIEKNRYGD